jgi:hypothetical protein
MFSRLFKVLWIFMVLEYVFPWIVLVIASAVSTHSPSSPSTNSVLVPTTGVVTSVMLSFLASLTVFSSWIGWVMLPFGLMYALLRPAPSRRLRSQISVRPSQTAAQAAVIVAMAAPRASITTHMKPELKPSDRGHLFASEILCCVNLLNHGALTRSQRPMLLQLTEVLRKAPEQIAENPSRAQQAADPMAEPILTKPEDPVDSFIDETVFFLKQVLPEGTRLLDDLYKRRPALG